MKYEGRLYIIIDVCMLLLMFMLSLYYCVSRYTIIYTREITNGILKLTFEFIHSQVIPKIWQGMAVDFRNVNGCLKLIHQYPIQFTLFLLLQINDLVKLN